MRYKDDKVSATSVAQFLDETIKTFIGKLDEGWEQPVFEVVTFNKIFEERKLQHLSISRPRGSFSEDNQKMQKVYTCDHFKES